MLIDLQKAIDHPSWGQRNNVDAEQQIYRILTTWRKLNMPIIHIKHMSTDPNSHYRPGQAGNDFKDIVLPLNNEVIITKGTNSAFIETELSTKLREDNITDIVIVGVITNNSVEATARMSGNLGFGTCVVSDASYTFNKKDYSGKWHDAEEVHNMSLANLSGEYADILTTDNVLKRVENL